MMVLVTGGSASGKSAYAERVACSLPAPRLYLATMNPAGADAAARIERHRALRAGKGFETMECYGVSFSHVAEAAHHTTALLEDLGNVVANALFSRETFTAPPGEAESLDSPDAVVQKVLADLEALEGAFDNLVIVGNEVGCDGVRYDEMTESYIRTIGAVACVLAQRCDVVVECVFGSPHVVKGGDVL